MRLMRSSRVLILAIALLFVGSACRDHLPEPKLEAHRTIASQGEDRAVVSIKMAAGELDVREGAEGDLMRGSFYFNRRPWEPRIDHQVSGGVARLVVEQRRMGPAFGRVRNNWDVALSGKTPMELRLDLGVGRAKINLSGVRVTKLDIQVGVGGMDLDLSGPWAQNLTGQIEGGIGRAEILLPEDIGVRIRIEGGLGSIEAPGFIRDGEEFRNDAWGKTSVSLDLGIEAGIGRIDLVTKHSRSASY